MGKPDRRTLAPTAVQPVSSAQADRTIGVTTYLRPSPSAARAWLGRGSVDTGAAVLHVGAVAPFSSLPVYWRVCLINAAVFLLATVILVVRPATVNPDMSVGQLGVLALGLGACSSGNADDGGDEGTTADAASL